MFTAINRGAASPRTMRHFRPAGKPRTAEAPKPRILHGLDHRLDAAPTLDAVAAALRIRLV